MQTGLITADTANEIRNGNEVTIIVKSDVLTSTSREGDFVHQNQTMSGDVGFKNVSRLWYDKTISFDDGREMMAKQRMEREDIEFAADAVEFSSDDKGIIVKIDDRDFRPTPYALAKLCSWYHTPQTMASYYLNPPNNGKYKRDSSDYDVVCYALENGVRRVTPDKELLFRTYKDGTLRSVMSDSYSIVDNDWYLDLLSHLIPGGRLSHWRGDADTIYGNVIIPDTIREEKDSEYGGMLSLSNCEIGKRVIAQTPSIYRAICQNGNIWGSTKGVMFKQRHKGINLEDLAESIKANIIKQIPLLTSGVDLLLATKNWKIQTRMVNIMAAIGKEYKISAAIMNDVCGEYLTQGKDETAFGAIDAITRVSQKQDNETYVQMDSVAGQLIYVAGWNKVNAVAKSLDEADVKKLLNYTAA